MVCVGCRGQVASAGLASAGRHHQVASAGAAPRHQVVPVFDAQPLADDSALRDGRARSHEEAVATSLCSCALGPPLPWPLAPLAPRRRAGSIRHC